MLWLCLIGWHLLSNAGSHRLWLSVSSWLLWNSRLLWCRLLPLLSTLLASLRRLLRSDRLCDWLLHDWSLGVMTLPMWLLVMHRLLSLAGGHTHLRFLHWRNLSHGLLSLRLGLPMLTLLPVRLRLWLL